MIERLPEPDNITDPVTREYLNQLIRALRNSISEDASTALQLENPQDIYGNEFDGTADLDQVIASTYGGTGNGFTKFTGPTTSEKIFTLPDVNGKAILTTNAAVTAAQGGTGITSVGTAGNVLTSTGTAWESASSGVPVKASGAELDTGTDDAKFATAKALKDSGYLQTADLPTASTSVSGISELATTAETQTGTDTGRPIVPSAMKGALGFSKYYESASTAYSNNATTEFTHSLGAIPKLVILEFVCKTADSNWAVGDRLIASSAVGGSTARGCSLGYNTTKVFVVVGDTSMDALDKSDSSFFGLTSTSWELVVRAWA